MSDNVVSIVKKDTVDIVAARIQKFQENGELHFPPNYSPENALKSAWLQLQAATTGKADGYKPVLEVCTKDSIANSLLDMVIQGLNPAKKQCYFIAYGKQLVCQRSYLGTMAVTKTLTGIKDIYAEVVYKGDEFVFEIVRGRKKVTKHIQSIDNINAGEIMGAYCTVVLPDETERTEFMTIAEIQKAWSMSRNNPSSEGSTHSKFPQEMCKKTVINRACKIHLNSSDDSSLMMRVAQRANDRIDEAEVSEEISQNANQDPIDITYEEVSDSSDEQSSSDVQEPELKKTGAPF